MMDLEIFMLILCFTFIYCSDYCAIFTSSLTSGTNGYVHLHIEDDGSYTSYDTFIDMRNTNTSLGSPLYCDISKGMTYHVSLKFEILKL